MDSKNIHFPPALVARADTPIADCVKLMRKHNVGSVLIVSDTTVQQLVGIFTERDLLRTVELIQEAGHWQKPVRTVMTHPVRVLDASKLDRAGEVMLQHGIRHLPIVVSDEKIKYRLVGVISMRDLFKDFVKKEQENRKNKLESLKIKKTIGIITTDPYFVRLLEEGLAPLGRIGIQHLSFTDIKEAPQGFRAIILDLDHLNSQEWASALKEINRRSWTSSGAPFIVVVFTPGAHDPKMLHLLQKLGAAKGFAAFAKPVSVLSLFERLRSVLDKRNAAN